MRGFFFLRHKIPAKNSEKHWVFPLWFDIIPPTFWGIILCALREKILFNVRTGKFPAHLRKLLSAYLLSIPINCGSHNLNFPSVPRYKSSAEISPNKRRRKQQKNWRRKKFFNPFTRSHRRNRICGCFTRFKATLGAILLLHSGELMNTFIRLSRLRHGEGFQIITQAYMRIN